MERRGGDCRFAVNAGELDMQQVGIGDSIAVSGVCLTVVTFGADWFEADVSSETLTRTTLGNLVPGNPVNLEMALTPSTRMGGHIVSGHVDGVGTLVETRKDARSVRFVIEAPDSLQRYIAGKGSICVDGISLTVNHLQNNGFDVNIVPHTLSATTLGVASVGDRVNLEVDLLARYLERLLLGDKSSPADDRISMQTLRDAGFF